MAKVYEKSRVAVDAVIFTIDDDKIKVFLHKREKKPFLNKLELPGGLLCKDETSEETLKRKLDETIGRSNIFFNQFLTFTDPKRDPRERTVSIGYIALIAKDKIDDLSSWHNLSNLSNLAFDHRLIIQKARDYLRQNIGAALVRQFMPKYFPLNSLQKIFEIVEGITYDNRNFRKKMIVSGIVRETDKKETDVSHRPAKLYVFT